MLGRFDAYNYSRPTTYVSYTPKVSKPYVLVENDADTNAVAQLFQRYNIICDAAPGLSRGITFGDFVCGKRRYHHNSQDTEYFIHQWKPTNDLTREHPTGTHKVYFTFGPFIQELERIAMEIKLGKL